MVEFSSSSCARWAGCHTLRNILELLRRLINYFVFSFAELLVRLVVVPAALADFTILDFSLRSTGAQKLSSLRLKSVS